MYSEGLGGGGVRVRSAAGHVGLRRRSSLFGYIPFLQNDLSLPGGQLALVVTHGS